MQTLVLQDRQWDETNTRIFPKTTQLLKDIGVRYSDSSGLSSLLDEGGGHAPSIPMSISVSMHGPTLPDPIMPIMPTNNQTTTQAPTVEVFFAKQSPKTGIQPHSDGCNFVLTAVSTVLGVFSCTA